MLGRLRKQDASWLHSVGENSRQLFVIAFERLPETNKRAHDESNERAGERIIHLFA